jgi:hypothetical protein
MLCLLLELLRVLALLGDTAFDKVDRVSFLLQPFFLIDTLCQELVYVSLVGVVLDMKGLILSWQILHYHGHYKFLVHGRPKIFVYLSNDEDHFLYEWSNTS